MLPTHPQQDDLGFVTKIAKHVWRQYRCHQIELDDLIGTGFIALLTCKQRFEPAYGVTLYQYANRQVIGAMRDFIISHRLKRASETHGGNNQRPRAAHLRFAIERLALRKMHRGQIIDRACDLRTEIITRDMRRQFKRSLRRLLDDRQYKIIVYKFVLAYDDRQTGALLGLSTRSICVHRKRALHILREKKHEWYYH